jgi:hypothetical protein
MLHEQMKGSQHAQEEPHADSDLLVKSFDTSQKENGGIYIYWTPSYHLKEYSEIGSYQRGN